MKKLLLADDSATIERMVRLNFEGDNLDIVCARDGNQAILLFERERPDIVLADIYMPGKNGYDVCEFIKQNSGSCRTPVLLLRGSFEPFSEEEFSRVRADGVLTKPLDSNQLVDWVHRLLQQSHSDPAGPEEENLLELSVPGDFRPTTAVLPPTEAPFEELLDGARAEPPGSAFTVPAAPEEESDLLEIEMSILPISTVGTDDMLLEIPAIELRQEDAESTASPDLPVVAEPMLETAEPETAPAIPAEEPVLDLPPSVEKLHEEPAGAPEPSPGPAPTPPGELSEDDVSRIARQVVAHLSDRVLREIAWEIVPELAESIIRQELKKQNKVPL